MIKHREILRMANLGLSQRNIAESLSCSRTTVAEVLRRAREEQFTWPLPPELSDPELAQILFPHKGRASTRKEPDYEQVHTELAKKGVTLSLLWNEYCEQCHSAVETPYQYAQFCKGYSYSKYARSTKATMHIHRKPGEQMEVDWAGQTASVLDSVTGEIYDAYLFVAVLPSSQYAYAEAFMSRNQESWIQAHVNAFSYFGGVPVSVVLDNLKTGVERTNWYSPVINKRYHEMAEHYGTAILPARERKPKDKPSVEGVLGTSRSGNRPGC